MTNTPLIQRIFRAKSSISVIFFVYCVSILSQLIIILGSSNSYAASAQPINRLVAVLVDKSVYDVFAKQVDWYASIYLQAQYSDSKALIIPIEASNFKAQDIHKILQNLYFEGERDTPSQLIGVTLIGDVPLPVVNDNNYHYPTIYPYVDFIKPQFVYSEQEQIFIPNPQGISQNPEIWHNLIRFTTDAEYNAFFVKLSTYAAYSQVWVSDKIWVDDLIQEQASYDQGSLKNYINQFIFAEDFARQRYTNLLLDLTNAQKGNMVYDMFNNMSQTKIIQSSAVTAHNDLPSDLAQQEEETASNMKSYFAWTAKLASLLKKGKDEDPNTFDNGNVAGLSSSKGVPTLFLQQIMDGYLKDYHELYSQEYHTNVNNMVEVAGRYLNSGDAIGINSHIWKTYQHDELTKTIITNLNDQLEKAADNMIESEKVYMTIPIPTKKLYYRKSLGAFVKQDNLPLRSLYETSYFGADPAYSNSVLDLSIYRGRYLNLKGLKQLQGYDYTLSSPLAGSMGDYSSRSIGSSYGIQSREVESVRGYDVMLAESDRELIDILPKLPLVKRFCEKKDFKNQDRYIKQYRGGYTPLNIDKDYVNKFGSLQLDYDKVDHRMLTNPSYDYNLNNGIAYDAAGARMLSEKRQMNKTYDGLIMVDETKILNRSDETLSIYVDDFMITGGQFAFEDMDGPGNASVTPTQECDTETGDCEDIYTPINFTIRNSTGDILAEGSVDGKLWNEYTKEIIPFLKNFEDIDGADLGPFMDLYYQSTVNLFDIGTGLLVDNPMIQLNSVQGEELAYLENTTWLEESRKDIEVADEASKAFNLSGISDSYLLTTMSSVTQMSAKRPLKTIDKKYSPIQNISLIKTYGNQDAVVRGTRMAINETRIKPILYCDRDRDKQGWISAGLIDDRVSEKDKFITSSSVDFWKVFNKKAPIDFSLRRIGINDLLLNNKGDRLYEVGNTQGRKNRIRYVNEYYYKTLSTVVEHKSPTSDELYGKELTTFYGFDRKFPYFAGYAKGVFGTKLGAQTALAVDGLQFALDGQGFIIPGSDYSEENGKFYFSSGATIYLYGKNVPLKNLMAVISGKDLALQASDKLDPSVRAFVTLPKYGGMNIGTTDRAIDSVRYSSFQGIGGDLVELVYPNLYNVGVFDKQGKLLLEGEIKKNIEVYLVKQAQIYRAQLQEQQDKSAQFYQTQAKGFDLLATSDPYASPVNRPGYDISKITDDFFIKGLAVTIGAKTFSSDDVMIVLARNLYYQNLVSPSKESYTLIDKELDRLYATTELDNLNSKRSFIFNTYLKYDSNKTTGGASRIYDRVGMSGLLIPGYDSKGYEIASITSNGSDYHVNPNLDPNLKQFQIVSDTMSAKPRSESHEDNLAPLICNNKIFDWGGVPILQYPKSFSCWLEQIKKSSITISVNGDLVDIINTAKQGGWKAAITGYFADQLNYADSVMDYPAQRGSLIDGATKKYSKTGTSLGSQYQKRRGNLANKTGWNFLGNDDIYNPTEMTETERSFSTILNNLTVDVSSYQMPIDGDGVLSLSTINSSDPYTITISGTGSACLTLDGINTCQQSVSLNNRGAKPINTVKYEVGIANAELGDAGLLMKICIASTPTCVTYPVIYTIVPGAIASIKAIDILDGGYLARGSVMPIVIQGYDSTNRPLSLAPDPYRITSDQGTLVYMSQRTKKVDINTWKSLTMLYDSSTLVAGATSDRLLIAPLYPEELLPVTAYTIPIADPVLQVASRLGSTTVDKGIAIDLPSQPNTLTKGIGSGLTTLIPAKIPVIRLSLASLGGKQVLGEAKVSSQNGLVSVGVVGSQLVTGDNNRLVTQRVWSDQDSFILTGSAQDIYLYPSYKAGNDIIQVTIGDRLWSIPVQVNPGSPGGVTITAPERLSHNETGTVDLMVTDYWGNALVNDNVWLDLKAYGYAFVLGAGPDDEVTLDPYLNITGIKTIKGAARMTVIPKAVIGKGYITASVLGIPLDKQRSSYAGVLVQSILWPTKEINALILELKGNDWGALGKTPNIVNAPTLITQSAKLLSVVTNIADVSKLRESQLIINPHGGLSGPQSQGSKLTIAQGVWTIIGSNDVIALMDGTAAYDLVGSTSDILTKKPSTTAPSIYYIPMVNDDSITSNYTNTTKIIINDTTVLDTRLALIHPDVKLMYEDSTNYGAGVYSLLYRDRQVGRVVIYRSDVKWLGQLIAINKQLPDIYDAIIGYAGGSTNDGSSIHIVTHDSTYTQENQEKSPGMTLIAQFGQGLTVGDASKYYDQFSITYGDAALSRTSINVPAYALVSDKGKPAIQNTPYDSGIGQAIYHDPDKPIDRVQSIDFNNDGFKDLLVVYTDGSIRLLKNYGGKNPWRDLGHLMIIADGIQQLYVGDVDKNGYQDIIVHTQAGKLRVYYNNKGQFDVDGYPVCLDIAGGPDDLSQLYYWTIRDMDLDSGIDIVTYDYNGDIKIFYGGSRGSSDGSSYVSKNHDLCDGDWKGRQQSTLVQSFGMNILTTPIKDDSLIHWATHINGDNPYDQPDVNVGNINAYTNYESLSVLEDETTPTMHNFGGAQSAGVGFDADNYEPPSGTYNADEFAAEVTKTIVSSVNVSQTVNRAYGDATRYTPVQESLRPIYQKKGNVLYLPLSKVTPYDPFGASKIFQDINGGVLVDRDLVKITIKITGTPGVQFAYLDKLTGPWVVPLTKAGGLEGASDDFTIHKNYITYNREGYIFAVNGATMDDDGVIELSYIVQYRSEKLADVEVIDTPGYPMVQATSLDSCQKVQRLFLTEGDRRYITKGLDHKAPIIRGQTASYTEYDDAMKKQTADIISSMGKEDGVLDYLKERWNNDNVFQRTLGVMDGTYLNSIPTQFRIGLQTGAKEQEVSRKITDFTNKLCNGFKLGSASCAGTKPPVGVPFNMAFPPLTPGVVNAMGYKIFNDKGLPLLAFPTSTTPFIWPPNPSGAGGWFKGNTSQFRFYATPTLTTALGFAFCFGPYGVGVKLPSPFKNVVGNCIVVATQPLLKKQKQCSIESSPDYTPPPELDIPTCYGDLTADASKTSATQMVTFDQQTQAWLEQQRLTSPSDYYYNNTYYGGDARATYASSHPGVAKAMQASNGVISLGQPARVSSTQEILCLGNCGGVGIDESIDQGLENFTSDWSTQGLGGAVDNALSAASPRKIGRGVMKGIGACIMQIADNQIQYIKNNLLTSSLTIVLPDLSRLGATSSQRNTLDNNATSVITSLRDGRKRAPSVTTGSVNIVSDIKLKNIVSRNSNPSANSQIISTLGKADVNPFHPIEQLFNDIDLINISQKDILVKVPFIRTTDLSLYKTQFIGRGDRNIQIMEQWGAYGRDLGEECGKLSDPEQRKKCAELLKQVVYINNQLGQFKRSYNANVVAFDQYAHFQSIILPNWKEQQVRYLTEMTNVINSTMSQLAGWSTQNAARFTSWTSAIRSIITAVKTWQLLVDFAKNWKERCGTCKIDNYDFATCSLNGLCPNFPLFAWPNFRTPDFTIDLSNIDAGIDLIVPNFIFQPVDVPLYRLAQLPDLPLPPQLGSPVYAQLNIIIPTLPVIPSPPSLPSLPSLSMTVDMDLPLLPPAPKIPMLPETLNAAVQVADFIGKILCIVKGNIGLVGEKFVKQKIEQITARTREVSPFDTISPIVSQPRPQGYNARLDAYVNLRFYFDGLYNVFDEIVDNQWNQRMHQIQQQFNGAANQSSLWVNGLVASGQSLLIDKGAIPGLLNGDGLPQVRFDTTISPISSFEFDTRIVSVLNQFALNVDNAGLINKSRSLIGFVQKPIQAQVNLDGIDRVRNAAQGIVTDELINAQSDYQQIKYDYDTWLDTLTSDQYVSNSSQTTKLSSSLYTINPEVAQVIESSDLRKDYLQGNKELLERYQAALTNPSSNLELDTVDQQESRDYVDTMLAMTDQALDAHKSLAFEAPIDDQNNSDLNTTVDASSSSNQGTSSSSAAAAKVAVPVGFDQTNQREGYLVNAVVTTSVGKVVAAVDVIKPEGIGTQYRETSFREDMNGNPLLGQDIVLWDTNSIYIKYASQKDIHGAHRFTKIIYRLPLLTSPGQLEQLSDDSNGYIKYDVGILSRSQWFKLWSHSYAITNFELQGQDYDNALFQWTNPDIIGQARNEAYLIRFTNLVDRHPDWMGPDSAISYVLVTPDSLMIDPESTMITLPNTSTKRLLKDLLKNKIVHDIVSYDPTAESIIGLLRNLPRSWNYAEVVRMEMTNGSYLARSPRSNQDVGGHQIAADTVAPIPEVKLIRIAKNEQVGGGTSMQGYINTNYNLEVTWKDNISIARTSVRGITQARATKTIITKIYQQEPTVLKYSFSAQDSSNNVTTIQVIVTIVQPELETTSADNTDGARGTVTAELSPDLDDGVIKFQQQDSTSWKNLIGMPNNVLGYPVRPYQTTFTGGLYNFPNSRGLKNADGTDAGSVSSQGQVTADDLKLLVQFPQGYPVISMVNASGVVQYELTYAPQTLTGSVPVDIKSPSQYRLLSLQNFNTAIAGVFAQGQCIAPQLGECEVYVSKQGDIWVDPAVRKNYYGSYVWRDGHGVYQIMRDKTFVAEVNLLTKTIK